MCSSDLVATYRQIQLQKLKNVEVHTGVGKMTAEQILSYGADKVVLATGSHWSKTGVNCITHTPVEGLDASLPYVCTPEQILMENKPVGDNVLVVDGDGYFTGVSIAEYLADRGKHVKILTPLKGIAPYTHFTLEAPNLHRMMYEKKIHELCSHWLLKVEPGKATAYYLFRDGYKRNGAPKTGVLPRRAGTDEVEVKFDTIVICTGRVPNDSIAKELLRRKDEWAKHDVQAVYQAGDCYAPQLIAGAVFEGHRIAREFESPNPQRP